MKDFMKKLVWVIVLVAILIGVYFVLPAYPHAFVQGKLQSAFDKDAKSRIEQVQAVTYKDVENKTYKEICEARTTTGCWVYQSAVKSVDGAEHVYYYARGASINLKPFEEYGGLMYTSAIVKIDFAIKADGSIDIIPYVEDMNKPLKLNADGKHLQQDKEIKKSVFEQMYYGMKSDN